MVSQKEVLKPHMTIRLEPVAHTQETLGKWIEWINDPEIRKWMYNDLPHSPEDINLWLYNATHDPNRHYFSISADNNLIGIVSLRQDQAPNTTGEIGIVIGEKEYQSRGIGTAIIDAIDGYAKDMVGLSSIRAMIKPDNEKSIRLFTGHGFIPSSQVTVDGVTMIRFEKVL